MVFEMNSYLAYSAQLNMSPKDGFKIDAETPAIAAKLFAEFLDSTVLMNKPFVSKRANEVSILLSNGEVLTYRISMENITVYRATHE